MQTVVQEVRRAMGQESVALHLPKADASAELAPLYWLMSQRIHRASRPHLRALIVYTPPTNGHLCRYAAQSSPLSASGYLGSL